eukprot:1161864-Pelagomonas_calceolata.AAC.31
MLVAEGGVCKSWMEVKWVGFAGQGEKGQVAFWEGKQNCSRSPWRKKWWGGKKKRGSRGSRSQGQNWWVEDGRVAKAKAMPLWTVPPNLSEEVAW